MTNFVGANYIRCVKMMLGFIKNSYSIYFVRVMRSCVRDKRTQKKVPVHGSRENIENLYEAKSLTKTERKAAKYIRANEQTNTV